MCRTLRDEIEERIARLEDAKLCASMSDDFAYSNGRIDAFNRDIAEARAELAKVEGGRANA